VAKKQSLVDKFIKDKHSNVVLWQTPNGPIILWAFAELMAGIIGTGATHRLFAFLSFGALFTWAWLEIFQGASYFRRALGLLVLILSIYSKVK
jgi:hypothetical protein